ncbi:MAG: ROK family transcriptional regulator [Paenibacillaceae bacterium]|nr:ROK family transcriptional regulator [Paenibacillaceae bacterium]
MAKSRGRGPTLAKDMNRLALYRQIKRQRVATRAELARRLELNKNTVGAIVDELIRAGYVRETGPQTTGGAGRNPRGIEFHAANKWAIGAQVTADALHLAAADLYGEPLATRTVPLGEHTPDAVADALALAAEALLREHGAGAACIGMGIGVPALLDEARAAVLRSSHLGWSEVPLAAMLQPRVPVPLLFDNSVKLSTLGEAERGAGAGCADFVYAHFGGGVGCGIIAGGALVRGQTNAAGELGHIALLSDGPLCSCGNRGCLETLVSVPALTSRIGARAGVPAETVTMPWIVARLASGDTEVASVMEEAGKRIGQALGALAAILNPRLIVCDGSLMEAAAYLFPIIRGEMERCGIPASARQAALVRSSLTPWAGALGAAAAVIRGWEDTIDPLALVTD